MKNVFLKLTEFYSSFFAAVLRDHISGLETDLITFTSCRMSVVQVKVGNLGKPSFDDTDATPSGAHRDRHWQTAQGPLAEISWRRCLDRSVKLLPMPSLRERLITS